jgi:hypothetical protein
MFSSDRKKLFALYLVTGIILSFVFGTLVAATETNEPQIYELAGGTFDLTVTVLVTEDTAFAKRYVNENLDGSVTTSDFDSRGTTFTSINGYPTIVWLPRADDISIVHHELLHATIDIMRRVNIPLNDETEEAFTYELQYLSNEFYKMKK